MSQVPTDELIRDRDAPDLLHGIPPSEDLRGRVLADRYHITDVLGVGGMAIVYRGKHKMMSKPVAIKVMRREYTARTDLVRRFLNEARAVSKLSHDHIVDVTDIGRTDDDFVYCVMELLRGEDLATTLRNEGPMVWGRVKPIVLQLCRALQAAHQQGIVHRDLKLENCFRVDRTGHVDFIKILDFGLAKILGGGDITRVGTIMGTAEYMAPEQARGSAVDHRVDIYAIGVMMYALLTGRLPFRGETFMDVLTLQIYERPRPLHDVAPERAIPAEVEMIVLRALSKDPEDRFQTTHAMAEAVLRVAVTDKARHMLDAIPADPAAPTVLVTDDLGTARDSEHSNDQAGTRLPGSLPVVAVGVLMLAIGTMLGMLLTEERAPVLEGAAKSDTPFSAGVANVEPASEPVVEVISSSRPARATRTVTRLVDEKEGTGKAAAVIPERKVQNDATRSANDTTGGDITTRTQVDERPGPRTAPASKPERTARPLQISNVDVRRWWKRVQKHCTAFTSQDFHLDASIAARTGAVTFATVEGVANRDGPAEKCLSDWAKRTKFPSGRVGLRLDKILELQP